MHWFLWLLASPFILYALMLFVLGIYATLTMGVCTSTKQLHGKVAIVTGGNNGIGFETALNLAKRGAKVIIGCRNKAKGLEAVKKIKAAVKTADVRMEVLDLNEFASVRSFADAIKSQETKVDILVNNAGIAPQKGTKISKDGYDMVLQTNHFAPFYLTMMLQNLLSAAVLPRIVNVGSAASKRMTAKGQPEGYIDYKRIERKEEYERSLTYGASKFMNTLFSKEIARRWGPSGFLSYSLHPGVVRTSIFDNMEMPPWFEPLPVPLKIFLRSLTVVFSLLVGKNCRQGAQTTIFCCVEDDLINGEYYSDCRIAPEYFRNAKYDDPKLSSDLWDFSEKIMPRI